MKKQEKRENDKLETRAEKLSKALRYRTVSRFPGEESSYEEYDAFITFLEKTFPSFFADAEVERVQGHSLLCRLPGKDAENGRANKDPLPVLFLAHYDVVPAGREESWEYPPFSGTITDTEVWGRGAIDDKGCLISLLEATEELLQKGERPRRTIVFAFGHDEEIGGGEGASSVAGVLEEREERFSFILDEGMTILRPDIFPLVDKDLALIGVSEKGHVDICIKTEGSPGHSSTPPPSTAAGRLARAVSRIEAHPFPARITKPVEEFLKALSPYTKGIKKLLLSKPGLFSPLIKKVLQKSPNSNAMIKTTQAVTMLKGSEKENILPAESSAVVNCRILPGDSIDSVVRKIKADIGDESVSVEPIQSLMGNNPLPVSDIRGEGFVKIAEVVGEMYPGTIVAPSIVLGTTDSRHYKNLSDNIYRFVPFRINRKLLESVHGYNEHVSKEDFSKAVDFYMNFLRRL